MTSIDIQNLKVDIAVHTIDGVLQKTLEIPFRHGYWVYLTVENHEGKRESFPLVNENLEVMIFDTYAEALESTRRILHKYF